MSATARSMPPDALPVLILMRHASHRSGALTDEGSDQVDQTARSLAEWLVATNRRLDHVWYANQFLGAIPHPPVREGEDECAETAEQLRRKIGEELRRCGHPTTELPRAEPIDLPLPPTYPVERARESSPVEDDTAVSPAGHRTRTADLEAAARRIDRELLDGTGDVAVLVTNEPQVGWLLDLLTHTPMAFGHGEMVGIEHLATRSRSSEDGPADRSRRRARYRVRWAMTPSSPNDAAQYEALLAKVESKMKTAGAFGGLLVALLTFVVTGLIKDDLPITGLTTASLGLLLIASWLFFASLISYDNLTMPVRFWSHRRRRGGGDAKRPGWLRRRLAGGPILERPPSPSLRVLHQQMIGVWNAMFVPAVIALGLAFVPLLLSIDDVSTTTTPTVGTGSAALAGSSAPAFVWLAVVIALAIGLGAWTWHLRPRVGRDD